jgi:hypothetical protein
MRQVKDEPVTLKPGFVLSEYQVQNKENPLKFRSVNPNPNGRKKDHNTGFPLNQIEFLDIIDLYYGSSIIKLGAENYKNMLFKSSFDVYIGPDSDNLYFPNSDMFKQKVIECHWMPWLHELYDYLKMFGICPYYYKKIILPGDKNKKETEDAKFHLVPVIPPMGSGQIFTYMVGKEQDFYWKWNNIADDPSVAGMEDGSVYFVVKNRPTLDGKLTSIMKSLVADHVYVQLLEAITVDVAEGLSQPTHVIGYAPDLKSAGEIAFGQGSRHSGEPNPTDEDGNIIIKGDSHPSYTVKRPMTNLEYVNNYRKKSFQNVGYYGRTPYSDINLSDDIGSRILGRNSQPFFYNAMHEDSLSHRFNAAKSLQRANRFKSRAEKLNEKFLTYEEEKAYNRMSHVMWLEQGETYNQAAQPTMHNVNVLDLKKRLDEIMSAAADYPLFSFTRQMGEKAGSNTILMLENKIKADMRYYSGVIREVLSLAYLPVMGIGNKNKDSITYKEISDKDVNTNPERKERFLSIVNSTDIQIIFPRIPMKEFSDFIELYRHRMIYKEELFKYCMEVSGLTNTDNKPPQEFLDNIDKMYPLPSKENQWMMGAAGPVPLMTNDNSNKKPKENNNSKKKSKEPKEKNKSKEAKKKKSAKESVKASAILEPSLKRKRTDPEVDEKRKKRKTTHYFSDDEILY